MSYVNHNMAELGMERLGEAVFCCVIGIFTGDISAYFMFLMVAGGVFSMILYKVDYLWRRVVSEVYIMPTQCLQSGGRSCKKLFFYTYF